MSRGTVRDGTGAGDVVRYLRTAASHDLAGGRYTGLATYLIAVRLGYLAGCRFSPT